METPQEPMQTPPPPVPPPDGYVPPPVISGGPGFSEPVKTSSLAVASLVLGILGCWTCITGIVGLIMGIISLNQINSSRGRIGGQGLAIAGIVISGASLFFFLIFGLIVVPKLMGAARQAKESTLKANLQRLRSAISQFQADTGVYPARLEDVVSPAGAGPSTGGGGNPIKKGSYMGPYLFSRGGIGGNGLPMNPFVKDTDTDVSHHWIYRPADGEVLSAVSGTTLDGMAYSDL